MCGNARGLDFGRHTAAADIRSCFTCHPLDIARDPADFGYVLGVVKCMGFGAQDFVVIHPDECDWYIDRREAGFRDGATHARRHREHSTHTLVAQWQ